MNELQNLSDQAKFRLNEINKIKDYFNSEIKERKSMSYKTYHMIMLTKCLLFCLHLLVL